MFKELSLGIGQTIYTLISKEALLLLNILGEKEYLDSKITGLKGGELYSYCSIILALCSISFFFKYTIITCLKSNDLSENYVLADKGLLTYRGVKKETPFGFRGGIFRVFVNA
jgi:hypothetical protein